MCTKLGDPPVLLLLAEAVDDGPLAPGVADLLPPSGDLVTLLLASRIALVSGILVLKNKANVLATFVPYTRL